MESAERPWLGAAGFSEGPLSLQSGCCFCLVTGYHHVIHSLPKETHFSPSGPEQPLNHKQNRKVNHGGTEFHVVVLPFPKMKINCYRRN